MRKLIAFVLLITMLGVGCSNNDEVNPIKNKYPPYGLFDEKTNKSELVCYEVNLPLLVGSLILIEIVFPPLIVIGFALYYPVRMKNDPNDKCNIDGE